MIPSKKAVAFTMGTIIAMVLGLFVIGFLVFGLFDTGGKVTEVTSCKINNGDLIEEDCDPEYATTFVLGNTKEGTCCKQKATVNDDDYKEWLEDQTPITIETETTDPNEIPVIGGGSGRAENILLEGNGELSEGESRLWFNGKPYEGKIFTVGNKDPVLISATHNNENGEYCHLYVVEAESSGGSYQEKKLNGRVVPYGGFSFKLADCAPEDNQIRQLQIKDVISSPGYYMAFYTVKTSEGGETLSTDNVVFQIAQQSFSGEALRPTVSFPITQDSRGTDVYCWGQVLVETYGLEVEDTRVETDVVSGSCGRANYQSYSFGGSPQALGEDEQLCIRIAQPYVDSFGEPQFNFIPYQMDGEECNFVQLFSGNQEDSCSQTCGDYSGSTLNLCTDYERRASGCQFSPDCYLKGRGGNSCETCNVDDCDDYKNEESCVSNQCLRTQACEWQPRFFGIAGLGRCVPHSGSE